MPRRQLHRPTILVVDDDRAVLRNLLTLLPQQIAFSEGYDFKAFTGSVPALAWLKQHAPSVEVPLMLSDFALRGERINGVEVLRRAKILSPRTRRVLYSGYATRQELEAAFNERCIDAFFDYSALGERRGFSQMLNNLLDGWNEERAAIRGMCFVIMPFSKSFTATYKGSFKPAIESLGYACLRADERHITNRYVVDDIVRNIRQASLVVADVTMARPSVLYEIGIAHAMAKPVILFTQNRRSCPFDLRSFRVVKYVPGSRGYHAIRAEIAGVLRDAGNE